MDKAKLKRIEAQVGAAIQPRELKIHFVYGNSPEAIDADIEGIKVRFDYHEREDDHLFVCIVETEDSPRPETDETFVPPDDLEGLTDEQLEDQIEEIEKEINAGIR